MNTRPKLPHRRSVVRRRSPHADMRRKNRSAILTLIHSAPGLSSAEIARRSGLAPQTVSVLLKGLLEEGIVVRGEGRRGRRGQPAVPIRINAEGGYGVGVEVGWRHVDVVLLDLAGTVLAQERWPVAYQRPEMLLPAVIAAIDRLTGVLVSEGRRRILGVGVAMPNQMPTVLDQLGASPEEAAALAEADIADALSAGLGLPVLMQNDGTAACRAECSYGDGAHHGDFVHIFIGTYVGAGIYVDGRVIEGRSGEAATLGASMVPDAKGRIRALHHIASVKALEDRITAAGGAPVTGMPETWDWEAVAPEATAWIEEAAAALALTIANSCTVIDFSAAVIDGLLPRDVLDRLAARVRHRMAGLPIATFAPPLVTTGRIGPYAPAIGAANMPLYHAVFAPEADYAHVE